VLSVFFFSSRRRHTRSKRDWSSDVCSSDLRLIDPTAGTIEFHGEELTKLTPRELRTRRRNFQIIFQDPYGSLDPRMTVEDIVAEIGRASCRERVWSAVHGESVKETKWIEYK